MDHQKAWGSPTHSGMAVEAERPESSQPCNLPPPPQLWQPPSPDRIPDDDAEGWQLNVTRSQWPTELTSRGSTIQDAAERAITQQQLTRLAGFLFYVLQEAEIRDDEPQSATYNQRISWDIINMYHINQHFVKPLTKQAQCSYVELVADGPQQCVWFVSHYWGGLFGLLVQMLVFHAKSRALDGSAAYWICTLANRQHDLSELSGTLESTPFYRAIQSNSCRGVVAVMGDERCVLFERVWCCFEAFVVLKTKEQVSDPDREKWYDVAAWNKEGDQHRYHVSGKKLPIAAGPALQIDLGAGRTKDCCEQQGAYFPGCVAKHGVRTSVETAEASRASDKKTILHLISDTPVTDSDPPSSCHGYDHVNNRLRRFFKGPAVWAMAENGETEGIVELLRDSTEGINHQGSLGVPPICIAAHQGHVGTVQTLAELGAAIDQPNEFGFTPLCYATQNNQLGTVNALLAVKAEVNHGVGGGVWPGATPLTIACGLQHESICDALVSADGGFCASNCFSSPGICLGSCLAACCCNLCCCRACGLRGCMPAPPMDELDERGMRAAERESPPGTR